MFSALRRKIFTWREKNTYRVSLSAIFIKLRAGIQRNKRAKEWDEKKEKKKNSYSVGINEEGSTVEAGGWVGLVWIRFLSCPDYVSDAVISSCGPAIGWDVEVESWNLTLEVHLCWGDKVPRTQRRHYRYYPVFSTGQTGLGRLLVEGGRLLACLRMP